MTDARSTSVCEHTPTPWHIGSTEHTELIMGFKDNSECVLAELDTDDVSMEETAANAAFIVECVNNHTRLTAELEIARKALEPFAEIAKEFTGQLSDDLKNTMHWAVPTVGEFRAALRALQGQQK